MDVSAAEAKSRLSEMIPAVGCWRKHDHRQTREGRIPNLTAAAGAAQSAPRGNEESHQPGSRMERPARFQPFLVGSHLSKLSRLVTTDGGGRALPVPRAPISSTDLVASRNCHLKGSWQDLSPKR